MLFAMNYSIRSSPNFMTFFLSKQRNLSQTYGFPKPYPPQLHGSQITSSEVREPDSKPCVWSPHHTAVFQVFQCFNM